MSGKIQKATTKSLNGGYNCDGVDGALALGTTLKRTLKRTLRTCSLSLCDDALADALNDVLDDALSCALCVVFALDDALKATLDEGARPRPLDYALGMAMVP